MLTRNRLITLHRTALILDTNVFREQIKRHSPEDQTLYRISQAEEICVASARAIVRALNELKSSCGDLAHLLTASAPILATFVLTISILKHPARWNVRSDLAVRNPTNDPDSSYSTLQLSRKTYSSRRGKIRPSIRCSRLCVMLPLSMWIMQHQLMIQAKPASNLNVSVKIARAKRRWISIEYPIAPAPLRIILSTTILTHQLDWIFLGTRNRGRNFFPAISISERLRGTMTWIHFSVYRISTRGLWGYDMIQCCCIDNDSPFSL